MGYIYVIAGETDRLFATALIIALEAEGQQVWHPDEGSQHLASVQQLESKAIAASRCIILIWSANAATDDRALSQMAYSQRLQKRIICIRRDTTRVPTMLVGSHEILRLDISNPRELLDLLPPQTDEDLLIAMLTGGLTRERRAVIERLIASESPISSVRRAELLAALDEVARTDPQERLRKIAITALDRLEGRSEHNRHNVNVHCPKCGYQNIINRCSACLASGNMLRHTKQKYGRILDEIFIFCGQCNHQYKFFLDCEGYRAR